jgi:regulator of protease activity HflC (stomatin/prohibitin superfamily)
MNNIEMIQSKTKTDDDAPGRNDEKSRTIESFWDQLDDEDRSLIRQMPVSENFIEGVKKVAKPDEMLVSDLKGNSFCCCFNTTILEGEVGCATKHGLPLFFPPGNYFWMGLDVHLDGIKTIDQTVSKNGDGTCFRYKDEYYVNLDENNLAVVQINSKTLILGSGRYILREPAVNKGKVDVQNLKKCYKYQATTENAGEVKAGMNPRNVQDEQVKVDLIGGYSEMVGNVTFCRAQPGFCYVIQDPEGNLRSGIGLTVCRGGEKLLQFCDRQNYGRTTRRFTLESHDRQEVGVRVQLRWRLQNARIWLRVRGAFEDIFDAIEETVQALLRDAIAGQTYEECMSQASAGYEGIESLVVSRLEEDVNHLGGKLLGFEIRELRFPLLERRNVERAEKEAIMTEKLYEEKRRLNLEDEKRKRTEAKLQQDMKVEKIKLQHRAEMQQLRDQANLEKMRARAALEEAKERLHLEKQELLLKGQKLQQDVSLATDEARAAAENTIRQLEAKSQADKKLENARAESESIRARANADAEAKVKLSEADAKAAQLIGSAYKSNPAFLRLKMEELNSKMMHVRADAMGRTLKANPTAFMPVDLQREMAFLRSNISPIAPVVIPGGGGVVTMPTKEAEY